MPQSQTSIKNIYIEKKKNPYINLRDRRIVSILPFVLHLRTTRILKLLNKSLSLRPLKFYTFFKYSHLYAYMFSTYNNCL